MANVLFKRGNTDTITGTAITDGQLLYDTTTGQTYIDVGSVRKPTGRPVANTTAEVSAITADYIPCGTKPVKELIESLGNVTVISMVSYNPAYLLSATPNSLAIKTITKELKINGKFTFANIPDTYAIFTLPYSVPHDCFAVGKSLTGKICVLHIVNDSTVYAWGAIVADDYYFDSIVNIII